MPNYLLTAGGLLADAQPWSIRAYAVSTSTEATVQTAWDTAFQAYWNSSSWLALVPNTTYLTYTYTSTLTALFKQQTKTQTTHNIAGGATGAALPYTTCFLASFQSTRANKSGHGRWYLPAPAVTAMATTGYVWSAAAMTAAQTALNAMSTARGSTYTLQIFTRLATESGIPADTLTPVATASASNKPATQRRRGDKVVPTRTTFNP